MASPLFWDEQKQLLYEILFPEILDAIQDGLLDGANAIGAELGLNWAVVNEWAENFAKNYTFELVSDITDSSRAILQAKIDEWMQSGQPLDELIDALSSGDLYSQYRAFMIATTEVTRAYGEGNLELWKASGVVKQIEWMTSKDEVVCEICGGLDGSVIDLGQAGWEGYSPGDEVNMVECPPAHVNCRCWMRPIWG